MTDETTEHAVGRGPGARDQPVRQRFDGHIVGVGTASGTRLVVGRWRSSPWGPFADVMVERPDGTRILLAPDEHTAEQIAATYVFDAVHVVPVSVGTDASSRAWHVRGGPLELVVSIGARTAIGRALRMVPSALAGRPGAATAMGPVAGLLVPGVSTRGTARDGRVEWYSARDQHAVTAVDARWGDDDLGDLRDVDPPTRFGFSSTPRRPAVTRITTTVEVRPGH